MAGAVDTVASLRVFVERFATQLTVNSKRVVTTVGTVTAVTSPLKQIFVKVTFIRLATTLACCTHEHRNHNVSYENKFKKAMHSKKVFNMPS